MVVEIVTFAVGVMLLALAGFAGYWAGKDSAQREAFYTISTLRRQVSQQRNDLERAHERNRLLMRHVNTARDVDVTIPEWMQS